MVSIYGSLLHSNSRIFLIFHPTNPLYVSILYSTIRTYIFVQIIWMLLYPIPKNVYYTFYMFNGLFIYMFTGFTHIYVCYVCKQILEILIWSLYISHRNYCFWPIKLWCRYIVILCLPVTRAGGKNPDTLIAQC